MKRNSIFTYQDLSQEHIDNEIQKLQKMADKQKKLNKLNFELEKPVEYDGYIDFDQDQMEEISDRKNHTIKLQQVSQSIVHSKTSSLNHSKVLNKENPKNTKSVMVDNISNFNKSYNSNNKTLIGHKQNQSFFQTITSDKKENPLYFKLQYQPKHLKQNLKESQMTFNQNHKKKFSIFQNDEENIQIQKSSIFQIEQNQDKKLEDLQIQLKQLQQQYQEQQSIIQNFQSQQSPQNRQNHHQQQNQISNFNSQSPDLIEQKSKLTIEKNFDQISQIQNQLESEKIIFQYQNSNNLMKNSMQNTSNQYMNSKYRLSSANYSKNNFQLQKNKDLQKNINLKNDQQFLAKSLKSNNNQGFLTIQNLDRLDFKVIYENEWQCLHFACYYKNSYMLQILLKQKVNMNCQNNLKQTPINMAAQNNCLEMCKLLLQKDANIQIKDNKGNTPLHYAAQNVILYQQEQYSFNLIISEKLFQFKQSKKQLRQITNRFDLKPRNLGKIQKFYKQYLIFI